MARATVEEHAAHVAALLRFDLGSESVRLDDALDRVLADDVVSPVDLPLFRNSQMDGFAVRAADVPGILPIVGEVAARPASPKALQPGTAVRIMTGAVVPEGADAVVPVERSTVEADAVTLADPVTPGTYVREPGEDLHRGDRLLPAGTTLRSRHLAALAAAGITHADVRRRVRVAVVTTGEELIEPGAAPAMGQVFDSNGTALAAAVVACGAVVASRVHVPDDPAQLETALRATDADFVITSGGISMGDHEVVRQLLEPLGARVGTVAMQPGGPQATAVFEGMPVICLPGNPVSTQLSFEVFVAPVLRALAGVSPAVRETRRLEGGVTSVSGKRQLLRGVRGDGGTVSVVGGAGSHLVAGLAASDVLIVVPEEVTQLAAGDVVETWAL